MSSRRHLIVDICLLCATLVMTYLTFAKEKMLYQQMPLSLHPLFSFLTVQAYYPLTLFLLAALVVVQWRRRGDPLPTSLYVVICLLFTINLGLCAANNVINVIQGRPLHGLHRGIGW